MLKKNLSGIIDILICPKTKEKLIVKDDIVVNTSNTEKYPLLNDVPILIDFNKSICREDFFQTDYGKSKVSRPDYVRNRMLYFFKRLASPVPKVTVSNIEFLKKQLESKNSIGKLLIVGGGTVGRGTESIFQSNRIDVVSFDIYYSDYVSFIADAHYIPLKDNSFDVVIIQYVLEHVAEPNVVAEEIERVLKPDGIVYAETPFLEQVHEAQYDYTRFTHSGHRFLFKNFEEIKSGIVLGVGTHLLWTLEYFFRGLFKSKFVGKIVKLMFFWLKYFDLLISEKYQIDMADSFYFIGRKSKNNLFTIKNLADYYKGADNR